MSENRKSVHSFCPRTSRDRGVCPGTFAHALVLGQRKNGTPRSSLSRDVPWNPQLKSFSVVIAFLKLPAFSKNQQSGNVLPVNRKSMGVLRHLGIIAEQIDQNCRIALLQLYMHMLYICLLLESKKDHKHLRPRFHTRSTPAFRKHQSLQSKSNRFMLLN